MPDFTPLYSLFGPAPFMAMIPVIIGVALWIIIIKGFALWHSARESQKWWFIALLVINTLGILEVVYLVWFRPKNSSKEIPEMSVDVSSSAQ